MPPVSQPAVPHILPCLTALMFSLQAFTSYLKAKKLTLKDIDKDSQTLQLALQYSTTYARLQKANFKNGQVEKTALPVYGKYKTLSFTVDPK